MLFIPFVIHYSSNAVQTFIILGSGKNCTALECFRLKNKRNEQLRFDELITILTKHMHPAKTQDDRKSNAND